MSDNLFTRCPNCETVFRVTEQHLKIANGKVRCGACLSIFSAKEHWVRPISSQSPNTPPSSKAQKSNPSSQVKTYPSIVPPQVSEVAKQDDSMLHASASAEIEISRQASNGEPTDFPINSFGSSHAVTKYPSNLDIHPEAIEEHLAALENTSEGDDLFDNLSAPLDDVSSQSKSNRDSQNNIVNLTKSEQNNNQPSLLPSDEDIDKLFESNFDENMQELDNAMLSEDFYNDNLHADPLDEFDDMVDNPNRSKIWLAASLTLLFLILGAVFYFWSNRNVLIAQNNLQGQIALLFCDYVTCKNTKQIKLISDAATMNSEGVELTLIVSNGASFEQPYPTIRVTFIDDGGNEIGSKDFTARQYLNKETFSHFMKINQHTKISLKTEEKNIDPDITNFNYTFL